MNGEIEIKLDELDNEKYRLRTLGNMFQEHHMAMPIERSRGTIAESLQEIQEQLVLLNRDLSHMVYKTAAYIESAEKQFVEADVSSAQNIHDI